MNDFIKKIISERRQDIHKAAKETPLAAVQKMAKSRGQIRSLLARLQAKPAARPPAAPGAQRLRAGSAIRRGEIAGGPDSKHANIIAEMKRASPSEGALCPDLNPARLAREYENAGAVAISILTEPRYFQGSDSDLQAVRKATKIPILRKDFTVDPWQVYQSAALGADVVLLIVAALELPLLKELYAAANEANLETIIEVHTFPELEIAFQFKGAIIGVNNRNLTTLQTDISTAIKLAGAIPKERISIVESGIKSRHEVEMFMKLGYRGFLIGSSLLKAKSPGAALAELIGAK